VTPLQDPLVHTGRVGDADEGGTMLTTNGAFASFAVPDIDAARQFYGQTLGLDVRDSREQGLIELHIGPGAPVLIYPKPDHKPAVFTVLNFPVSDIDKAVDELTASGVRMDRYDLGGPPQDDKGIVRGNDQGPSIAWFKDPAGNILSVLETDR
jgi:catechol 2,3-dioxygenase-like lactoylglutathione lyase family enzyme